MKKKNKKKLSIMAFEAMHRNKIAFGRGMINPLPNDKILDVTKLKAFVDDRLKIAEMMISLSSIE